MYKFFTVKSESRSNFFDYRSPLDNHFMSMDGRYRLVSTTVHAEGGDHVYTLFYERTWAGWFLEKIGRGR